MPNPRTARTAVAVLAATVLVAGVGAALVAPAKAEAAAGLPTTATTAPAPIAPTPPPAPTVPTEPTEVLVAALVPVPAPAPPLPVPAPAPAIAPPLPPASVDLQARIEQAFVEAVPQSWRDGLPTTLRVIPGSTSYATGPGLIEVGDGPASGSWSHLLSVVAHEFGHLIAFHYGTGEVVGAPPAGWPGAGHPAPAEAWADCVAEAFTGIVDPSYDLPPCAPEALDWTTRWLAGEL